jgi:PAS domain S-box-containing protein
VNRSVHPADSVFASDIPAEVAITALDATHNAVVLTDRKGIILWVNRAFTDLTGYSAAEAVGQTPRLLKSGEHDEAFYAALWRNILEGSPWRGELCNRRKDGSLYWEEQTITPVREKDGEIAYFIGIKQDITARKQADEQIRRYVAELEQVHAIQKLHAAELARVIEELAAENERAEAATQAKSEFLSVVSHEIRTPLNGIIGMTGLLLETALSGEQREFAAAVRDSADNLLSIVNDILDFSKIEAGKLELESVPFDLEAAVEDVVELNAFRAREKGIELVVWYSPDFPRSFIGDPGRIRQVLLNYLSNAIKFTERGHVLVEVDSKPAGEGCVRVRLAVHDTGVGIPPDKIDRLFQRFSQADSSTTRKYGGTGLGLAIAKQLAELMGGRVGVASLPGEGSTFYYTLSLPLAPPLRETADAPAALRGVRVLVVDDLDLSRFVIAEWCTHWGMRVGEASCSCEALEKLAAAHRSGDSFQIMIVDQILPELDGMTLCRQVRRQPEYRDLPLVLLSCSALHGDISAGLPLDADEYIPKPLRPALLLRALSKMLGTMGEQRPVDYRGPSPGPGCAEDLPPFAGRRVLLAEDNAINQKVACAFLARLGCRVEVAANGVEAVRMIREAPFDLVLMDCQMPEMDGFVATRIIRGSDGSAGHVPIVALTAAAMREDRERCLASGMDAYLSKPIRLEDLRTCLSRILGPDAPASSVPS